MTQAQFEETFKARKELFHQQMAAVRSKEREQVKAIREEADAQAEAIKHSYHAGNAELEKLRQATITANPAKRQKQDCYNIQRCLGKQLQAFATDYLNTTEAACKFNREEDKVVFTIEVPYCLTSKNANDHDNQ